MKKREPFIFSEEFFSKVDKAVAGAVASSEAAGLPRSYLHNYDELPEFEDRQVVRKCANQAYPNVV